jgi:hypothetical protein
MNRLFEQFVVFWILKWFDGGHRIQAVANSISGGPLFAFFAPRPGALECIALVGFDLLERGCGRSARD